MTIGDIVIIKHLPDWGECRIKEVYGSDESPYYEVSPLKTDGITFLMGLRPQDLQLIKPKDGGGVA